MHPFTDGNGRTSRVVFNALLRRGGMLENHYLPIKEINYLTRGGHEVRLRYTVATGDWKEMLEYFVNAAELYRMLLRKEVLSK
jgi:Fic family protein